MSMLLDPALDVTLAAPLAPAVRNALLATIPTLDGDARMAFWSGRPVLRDLASSCATLWLDPRDGQLYPVVHTGGVQWLARNLAFDVGDGCWEWGSDAYRHADDAERRAHGLLYSAAGAARATPPGWRLPTDEEWRALTTTYGGFNQDGVADETPGRRAYERLRVGGDSGFDAMLAGVRDPDDAWFHRRGRQGIYWTSTMTTLSPIDGQPRLHSWTFTQVPRADVRRGHARADAGLSVRLVRG
jgi:uncharacterized protein (TIGR02145 family)